MSDDVCGRGTFNGAAAQAAKFTFAPCVLHAGHGGPCDSGDVEEQAA